MPRTDCKPQLAFGYHPQLAIEVALDAPETSSDGGLLLLREADERLGLSRWFSALCPDDSQGFLMIALVNPPHWQTNSQQNQEHG